jgi:hypothetical protein
LPSVFSFIQITLTDSQAAYFASAYLEAYLPTNVLPNHGFDINDLGDAGLTTACTTDRHVAKGPLATAQGALREVHARQPPVERHAV